MANIWVEVERMFQYYKNDEKKFFGATQRFIDLIVKLALVQSSKFRKSELFRLKEVVLDYFFWNNVYKSTEENIKRYFKVFYF